MTTKTLVPIRWKVTPGFAHNMPNVKRGDVQEVEPSIASRYYELGYAQPAELRELGDPYKPYKG